MPLIEKLKDFAGSLAAATFAPDEYDPEGYTTYESNMHDPKELWGEIGVQLKRDADKVGLIDQKLVEAITAFDAGEKSRGVSAIMAIYNLEVKQFR